MKTLWILNCDYLFVFLLKLCFPGQGLCCSLFLELLGKRRGRAGDREGHASSYKTLKNLLSALQISQKSFFQLLYIFFQTKQAWGTGGASGSEDGEDGAPTSRLFLAPDLASATKTHVCEDPPLNGRQLLSPAKVTAIPMGFLLPPLAVVFIHSFIQYIFIEPLC